MQGRQEIWRWRQVFELVLWIIVLGAGAWLRLRNLDELSLWVDEVAVVRDSKQPLTVIWGSAFRAPLQFTTVKLARAIGETELVYRLPSALAGVAGIAAFMALVRRGLGWHVAPAAGALLALNGFHVEASREAKYYAFVVLCSTLCALFLLRLWNGAGSGSLWGFVLAGTAGLYFHGYMAAAVACQTPLAVRCYVANRRGPGRRVLKSLVPPLLGLIIGTVPFLLTVVSQKAVGRPGGQLWGTESLTLKEPEYYQEFLSVFRISFRSWIYTIGALALGIIGVVWRSRRLALLIVVTLVGPLVVAVLVKPMGYQHRYLAFALPFLLLLPVGLLHMVTRPFASVSRGAVAAIVALGAAALLGVSSLPPHGLSKPRANWRDVGGFLRQRFGPGDVVILPEGGVWMELLERYLDHPQGVDVIASKDLLRWPPETVRHGSRWWVLRQPSSRARVLEERVAGEFETDMTIPGFLLLRRHGTASRAELCVEAGLVLETLTTVQTEAAKVSTWPSRRAHAWTTIGSLYGAGGDISGARKSYERALAEDSTYVAARGALDRMARRGEIEYP